MKRRSILAIAISLVSVGIIATLAFRPPHRPRRGDATSRPVVELTSEQTTSSIPPDSLAWNRFRGPNGTGLSDDENVPTEWSESKNLRWKTKLPGPGSSSPVLTERLVFVTSYTGYGEQRSGAGDMQNLQRQLNCIDRRDGSIAWTRSIAATLPDDRYHGMGVPEHGYATNSPTTDGDTVYAFLGKSGVYAFDLDGKERWHTSVGTESGNRGWGTAGSLILYGNLVIVNAAEENHAIIALNKETGAVVWKAEAATLELCYGTPAIVHVDATRDDLVIAVPGEIWGLNPNTGKLTWYVETSLTDNLSPSVIVDGTTVYAFGGYRSSGSVAVRVGGQGDVTRSHVLWTSRNSSYVATPVLLNKQLHWIDDRGMYFCANAETGALIHRARTPGISAGERPVYASPIAINGKVYAQTRGSGLFILEPGSELSILNQNKFASDESVFNATPAVDNGQLFLRSYEYLYCVSKPEAAKGSDKSDSTVAK